MDRLLRPRNIFLLLALLVIAAVLFVPESETGAGAMQLTTYGTAPYGARGIHDVLARTGWRVERRREPLRAPLDTSAVYVLLDPPMPVSATEVGALLTAVRGGARAIVVPASGSALADSLRVRHARTSASQLEVTSSEPVGASRDAASAAITDAAAEVGSFVRYLRPAPRSAEDIAPSFPRDAEALVSVRAHGASRPAVMALRVGRGEVIALADASFLRNTAIRDTTSAVLATRILEWLDSSRRAPVVFDEYHQGFGHGDSVPGTIRDALLFTAPGRALLQLVAAGLLLLLVYGVRPIAPTPRHTIERRSPLEHVGALSNAYEQIGATRLSTRRLVRGLRRRRPMGTSESIDDDAYLSLVRERKPELATEAELLRAALRNPLSPTEWVAIGGAIDTIERTITQ